MKSRKQKLSGCTYKTRTGCGTMYVTINEDDNTPIEVFATMGKAGGCAASQIETICRIISISLQSGVDVDRIIKQMIGICCHSALTIGDSKILSCSDAIGKVLKHHMDEKKVGKNG